MWYSRDVRHEDLAGRKCAKCCVFPKFAPRLRARTIWKSKSLKHQVLGPLFEVQSAFRVAGAGISLRFKMRGRHRSSWGLQKRWQAWGVWRGSETMRFAWQGQGFCALRCWCLKRPRRIRGRVGDFMSRKCYFAVIISRGSYRSSYASAQLFRGRRNTFEAFT